MKDEMQLQEVSWIYYDVQSVLAKADSQVRFFQSASDRSNMELPGALPFPVSFIVERLELRILKPETAGRVLEMFPSATVQFHVANRIWGDWPFEELTRLRKVFRTWEGKVGEEGAEKTTERVCGVELEHKLMLEPQVHFGLYVYFGSSESTLIANFYLRAMLHGTKLRPVA